MALKAAPSETELLTVAIDRCKGFQAYQAFGRKAVYRIALRKAEESEKCRGQYWEYGTRLYRDYLDPPSTLCSGLSTYHERPYKRNEGY